MLTYDDACCEAGLYAVWLTRRYDACELAGQVAGILREGGYAVPTGFRAGLGLLSSVALADSKATYFPFESDDTLWLEHCRNAYPSQSHPSLTCSQRNGGRISWRSPA